MGKWYEIARLPNRFQRKCASDVQATYSLGPDGKIAVRNQCTESGGKVSTAEGTARRANPDEPPSKLKVTFFWPFSGDYWILALDPEYRWVLVGEPRRKYLWVLSRTPEMDRELLEQILEKARAQGYDLSELVRTRHRSF